MPFDDSTSTRSDSRNVPDVCLVTGGAGFIGSHVAESLLAHGHRVLVLDDLSGGSAANLPAGAEFLQGSVTDQALLGRVFAEHRVSYVFHLAAYAAEGLSHYIRCFNYENNLIGSCALINQAIRYKVKRFVFTSSIAVYGHQAPPLAEAVVPNPVDPYGIAKYAVELDLRVAAEYFGLPVTIFRPHNVYGPRQNIADRYRNVLGIFLNQAMAGRALSVYGDGLQTRAFSYIDDVVAPMVECLNRPDTIGEVFNVGGDTPTSVLELANRVLQEMGATTSVIHLPARNEVVHAFADHAKVRKFFPELPEPLDLSAGLKRMAAWARLQGPSKTPFFSALELPEYLPDFWKQELAND